MSDCERYEALISALIDGELSAAEEAEVRAHMAQCAQCAAMYEAFSAAGEALRAEASDVPATLHDGIMAKVELARKAQRTQNKIIRLRPMLTAAACLIVLAGTLLALKNTVGMRKDAAAPEAAEAPAMLFAAGDAGTDSAVTESAAESAPEAEAPPVMAAKKAAAEETGAAYDAVGGSAAMESMEAPAAGVEHNARAEEPETAAQMEAPAASIGTLYGADQVYPTVMVNGALYEWHKGDAIRFSGLPDGCEEYGEVSHTDADTPRSDGEFASLFQVSGTIYTLPGREDVVYLLLTTDWMEDTVVQFDRCG